MSFALTNMIYTLGLLVGMLFLLEVGRSIGLWRMAVDTEGALALTVYVIRDLEFPRLPGLVGMNDIDNVMVDLRKSMH